MQGACAGPCFRSGLFKSGSWDFWSLCIFCPEFCPNCACSQLFLVPYSFFIFCCSWRGVSRCKHCSKGSQAPGCLTLIHEMGVPRPTGRRGPRGPDGRTVPRRVQPGQQGIPGLGSTVGGAHRLCIPRAQSPGGVASASAGTDPVGSCRALSLAHFPQQTRPGPHLLGHGVLAVLLLCPAAKFLPFLISKVAVRIRSSKPGIKMKRKT